MRKILALLIVITLPACGYQLARTGTGTSKYAGKYKVSVPLFVNKSYEPLVEKDVTAALKEELALDGRWVITDGGDEDIVVKGKVTRVELEPLTYDPYERILEYRLRIHMDVKVSEVKTGKVLWKDGNVQSFADYRVTVDVTKSKIRRSEAIKEASKRFAEDFIIKVLDIF